MTKLNNTCISDWISECMRIRDLEVLDKLSVRALVRAYLLEFQRKLFKLTQPNIGKGMKPYAYITSLDILTKIYDGIE